ncbi:mannose/cellobiose epimerase-like protein (N-acyl-D-glucosamine 2-epimerase family) [Kineosphaera limosa]|uniref:Putative sugar isomerase n=1 Tax=Kineosphaera limosa NBRC 100340 TaxID=1184609 RepID=K6X8M3_9MICO|nr:AGE family epimerase/isomerase [Kineosphaera limosa]NYE01423.1 mannose/cellobiose epimerase-like protein (N-acyl-D-glucosamine 2-epimerase family) [Kineosphaera limosa]GAB95169.1 putative sugar isomerase [Kineosphaera limosa NBRC 100340]
MTQQTLDAQPWLNRPPHLAWLDDNIRRLLSFAVGSALPGGGFAWLDADGTPLPDRTPQLFLTARMAHVSALGVALGIPGCRPLLDHAIASLQGLFTDDAHGGFFSDPSQPEGRKSTYDHVQVGLGAASAAAVGHPQGAELLETVLQLVEEHLWEPEAEALRESFARDFSDSENYRGANANMHGLEAFLAFGDVTGDPKWHLRGLAIARRCVRDIATDGTWLLPEHYDAKWQVVRDYNRDDPNHPFRPYGATYGHSLEWARLLLMLHVSPAISGEDWLVEHAVALAGRALDSWGTDGREGLVYTVDWDGSPVSRLRLHWPVCETIWTTSALLKVTADERWEHEYRRAWDFAATHFIDDRGTWINELDEELRASSNVWPGRPDFYHAIGALAGPTAPLSPFITLAATGHRSRIPLLA